MTRDEFLRQEAAAVRTFMDRFAMEDFLSPEPARYGLRYVCDDGFVTNDAGALWERCHEGPRQEVLPL